MVNIVSLVKPFFYVPGETQKSCGLILHQV